MAIALAQAAVNYDFGFTGATTSPATFGAALTIGSKLVCYGNVGTDLTAGALAVGNTTSITDTAGHTWTIVTSRYYSVPDYTEFIAYADNPASSASGVVVTVAYGASKIFRAGGISEWTGCATGAADTFTAGNDNGPAGTTTPTDVAMVTTQADLVISSIGTDGSPSLTAGAGCTLLGFGTGSSTGWQYQVQGAAGSVTSTFTTTSVRSLVISAAFKPSGGGGAAARTKAKVYNRAALNRSYHF